MFEPQTSERINAVQRINKPIRLFKTINFNTKDEDRQVFIQTC